MMTMTCVIVFIVVDDEQRGGTIKSDQANKIVSAVECC